MPETFWCENMKSFLKNYQPVLKGETDYNHAAVMLPLLDTPQGQSVLFEVRSSELAWQPGDICFPGGRIESGDKNAGAAAVRETCEELNLTEDAIEIYGPLDFIAAQMGAAVYPYAGKILTPEQILPSKAEVAEVFTVPLAHLLEMQPLVTQIQVSTQPVSEEDFPYHLLPDYAKGPRPRKNYDVYFYVYENRTIWGLTAKILKDFLDLCRAHCPS